MEKTSKKLTIGTVVYDDYDGFYFTIQAIRMYHAEVADDIHFVVINTNPSSVEGREVGKFCQIEWAKKIISYYEDNNERGCFTKGKIFDYAKTPYVLVIDPHVMIEAGAIKKLIEYFDSDKDEGNLLQGPLNYDKLDGGPCCFDPVWRGGMLGIWKMDKRSEGEDPFEIEAQGMGLFACRKDSWIPFPKGVSGFGGEECVQHEKFRKAGKKVICLPNIRWIHKFTRVKGIPYPNRYEDRVKNYYRGFIELDKPIFEIIEHFKTLGIPEETLRLWLSDVTKDNAIH